MFEKRCVGSSAEPGSTPLSVVVLVAAFFLLSVAGATGTAAAPDCSDVTYSGNGTEASPYEVGSVEQLQCTEEQNLESNYTLVSEIDASGTSEWNDGEGFGPIGNPSGEPLDGTFDGSGHEIMEPAIERPDENGVGMFGFVGTDSTVTNVSVVGANVEGNRSVGGLVGDN